MSWLAACAAGSWLAFPSEATLSRATAEKRPLYWLHSPPADAYADLAARRVTAASEVINDRSRQPVERLERYTAIVEDAERLLRHSAALRPYDASILARWIAVRLELSPPPNDDTMEHALAMLRQVSGLAPRVASVQLELGAIALHLGRSQEGAQYLQRAVQLDPRRAGPAIAALTDHLVDLDAIAALLPRWPEVLIALREPFYQEDRAADYASLLEPVLGDAEPRILAAFGDACQRASDPQRLLRTLERLGVLAPSGGEAERRLQLARAEIALSHIDRAVAHARQAVDLLPREPALHEHLGLALMAGGDSTAAVRSLDESLRLAARAGAPAPVRARLYRELGQAHELGARADLAFDAYRRAVALDPREAHAARRLDEMRRAAGVR